MPAGVAGVGPDAVGQRVSVRRAAGVEAGRPVYSDVVGRLLAWADGELFVLRHTGQVVVARATDLVAGKVVPPLPPKRAGLTAPFWAEVDALERVAERCWPAGERVPLGDWVLRAHHGVTRRANSVAVIGEPGPRLDDALTRVERWYTERGLPTLLQVPAGSDVDVELAARGYSSRALTLLMTAPLEVVRARLSGLAPDPATPVVTPAEGVPSARWLALAGSDPARRREIVVAGPPGGVVGLAGLPDLMAPVAIGRVVVDGAWSVVTSVAVAPRARRRGLALRVMAGLVDWARDRGARQVLLQVEADNTAARQLYDRLGFTVHHPYLYRSPGPVQPAGGGVVGVDRVEGTGPPAGGVGDGVGEGAGAGRQ